MNYSIPVKVVGTYRVTFYMAECWDEKGGHVRSWSATING